MRQTIYGLPDGPFSAIAKQAQPGRSNTGAIWIDSFLKSFELNARKPALIIHVQDVVHRGAESGQRAVNRIYTKNEATANKTRARPLDPAPASLFQTEDSHHDALSLVIANFTMRCSRRSRGPNAPEAGGAVLAGIRVPTSYVCTDP